MQLLFHPERDEINQIPYHIDGDPEMYSNENILKRLNLKQDKIVIESINDFLNFFKKNKEGIITKDEYFKVFRKVFQILRPKADPDEMEKCLKEDYETDNENKPTDSINSAKLFDSLFELADAWCLNIDPNEVKEFFDTLKFRFKNEGIGNAGAYEIMT